MGTQMSSAWTIGVIAWRRRLCLSFRCWPLVETSEASDLQVYDATIEPAAYMSPSDPTSTCYTPCNGIGKLSGNNNLGQVFLESHYAVFVAPPHAPSVWLAPIAGCS